MMGALRSVFFLFVLVQICTALPRQRFSESDYEMLSVPPSNQLSQQLPYFDDSEVFRGPTQKRALMRLGKRAMMRLGKRAMMRLGK